ncbi:MAG: hypothetical protein GX849_04205 [Clostridiaceae bacterium]|nr:hypothetical protein [Clostridiaceae bacterium]NLA82018.1 hypothetical protein [Clostridiaceae bacterium]
MKRVVVMVLIVLLLLTLAVGGAFADKPEEELEPTATLLSSTNTDDEGIDVDAMWEYVSSQTDLLMRDEADKD